MKSHIHENDRGTKKWTTMMLPEHKEQLKDMWEKTGHQPKPVLDEQQLEEFNQIIFCAYKDKRLVHVTYCSENLYSKENIREVTGYITEIDRQLQVIVLSNQNIHLKDFLDIEFVDASI